MSWLTEKEIRERDPDFCRWCTMPGEERTKEICDTCIKEHEGIYNEEEEE